MFDIYTIIFLALAVFIFLRLRSVLGQRTGRERPPLRSLFGARRGARRDQRQRRDEPIVQGSRFPNPEFSVPLYRRPRDLEAQGYKPGSPSFPNSKTVPIGRRNDKGESVPYPDRGQIEAGALDGQHLEICWVRDWFEALTIHIEGSARVMLEDGLMVRINYDSNGHPYSSIGRVLIERNEIPREEMSMQRIKDWMKVNPNKAAEVRATNRSLCSSASPASTRTTSRSARRTCR